MTIAESLLKHMHHKVYIDRRRSDQNTMALFCEDCGGVVIDAELDPKTDFVKEPDRARQR